MSPEEIAKFDELRERYLSTFRQVYEKTLHNEARIRLHAIDQNSAHEALDLWDELDEIVAELEALLCGEGVVKQLSALAMLVERNEKAEARLELS